MRRFQPLEAAQIDDALRIYRDAYAGVAFPPLDEHRQLLLEGLESPDAHLHGVFDDGHLVGVLRVHDYVMNVFGLQLPMKGLGGVAVGLCDKKNKIARDLVRWFLEHSHAQGAAWTSLYPFRASFYARMGFGSGPPMHRFHLSPESVPLHAQAPPARYLCAQDRPAIEACFARVQARTHGAFQLDARTAKGLVPSETQRLVGVEHEGRLEAYMNFGFGAKDSANPLLHDLEVLQWSWETTRGLHGLMNFLRKQADQVRRIRLLTQDPYLQHLFDDPIDASGNLFQINRQIGERGMGIMYRLIDPARCFAQLAEHDFGCADLDLLVELRDDFWGRTDASFALEFRGGRARLVAAPSGAPFGSGRGPAARLELGVGDFSALLLGVIPLGRLLDYGRARLNVEEERARVEAAFRRPEPPLCSTRF